MKKLLKNFIYHLEFKENKKYNTIVSLKNDIERFLKYFEEKKIEDINKIDFFMLKEYQNNLKALDFSISTFNRKISSLKKFYRYLKDEGIILENISLPLENIIGEREKEIEYLNDEEIDKYRLALAGNNFNVLRDRLIFELLYSSGITVAELLSLSERNFLLEKRELRFFNFKGKRITFFSQRCKEAYLEFIKIKKEKFKEENNEDIIFVNNSNKRLTDRSLRRIITKYKEQANIKREFSPYTIRHTFCIKMLKGGMPKEYLKKILDISNIDLLSRYERSIRKESL